MPVIALILTASYSKYMHSTLPKTLHPILDDPCLLWILRALPKEVDRAIVIVNQDNNIIEDAITSWSRENLLPCPTITINQDIPLGNRHAIQQVSLLLDHFNANEIIIVCGNTPLIHKDTITQLIYSSPTLLATDTNHHTGYGRIIQNKNNSLKNIIKDIYTSAQEHTINRINSGIYTISWPLLKKTLFDTKNKNINSEYHITDAIVDAAHNVHIKIHLGKNYESIDMNTYKDQDMIQNYAKQIINSYWMNTGITFENSVSTSIGPRVILGRGTIISSSVNIAGQTIIGQNTYIGQGSIIINSIIGNNTTIKPYSIINNSQIEDHCQLGPFINMREGNKLNKNVSIGNFVEVKGSLIKSGVKASHLSYIGDTQIGKNSNIGAGVITCNYDGFNKYKTTIGNNVFLGSACQLIAPITIGDQSIIAAGSTITSDVPPKALAINRTPLTIKKEIAPLIKERQKKYKKQ